VKKAFVSLALAVLASVHPALSHATLLTLDPTSDGSLYVCDSCSIVSDGAYVLVAGYIQGDVKFASNATVGTITQALLSLNPYALPLFGSEVAVYGYGTAIGALDDSDANAGVYLGTLVLPADLGFGEDVFFDVTSFVAATSAPFLAFNLRTTDVDVFSSLEYNYGHPSQLLLSTTLPEPAPAALLLAALMAFAAGARRVLRPRARASPGCW
jgi:hypothetical protein